MKDGHINTCKSCILKELKNRIKSTKILSYYHSKRYNKTCSRCNKIKIGKEFGRDRYTKDGLTSNCTVCRRILDKKQNNKYRKKKEVIFRRKLISKEYRKKHKIKIKRYRLQHLEELKQYNKIYRLKNKNYFKIKGRDWLLKNKRYLYKQRKLRKQLDVNYKLSCLIRSRLYSALKRSRVTKKWSAINGLGCTIGFLKKYLESKFQPGMTWKNWGIKGWHIDHKTPLTRVDLSNKEDFKKVCHYTNLQPLWWYDNISKGNKV